MKRARKSPVRGDTHVVWERTQPTSRPAPVPLTREQIVRAAMQLADEQGMEAVSLRNVGSALEAGPMRLYGYVATKEELLELMVDEVHRQMLAEGPLPSRGWRKVMRELAQRLRRAAAAHGWFVGLAAGRPHVGPHALAYTEASLAAVSQERGFRGIDEVVFVLRVLNAYVLGVLQNETSALGAERATGLNEAQWRESHFPYLQRMLETGRFPMVKRLVLDAEELPAAVEFERGLACVLDGIATRLRS